MATNIAAIYREYFGQHPSADDAADMAEYEDLPEMTVRAVFERTRRYAERPSWAYAKTVLANGGRAPEPPPVRRSVLCDGCRKPFDPDWMTLEGLGAFCKGCIDDEREIQRLLVEAPELAVDERGLPIGRFLVKQQRKQVEYCARVGKSPFTESAQVVRRHFGSTTSM